MPPHEWPTRMTGAACASRTRLTAAASSASEVNGFCTATTWNPLARSAGMTFCQQEASAHAPWTRTTVFLALSRGASSAEAALARQEMQRKATDADTMALDMARA